MPAARASKSTSSGTSKKKTKKAASGSKKAAKKTTSKKATKKAPATAKKAAATTKKASAKKASAKTSAAAKAPAKKATAKKATKKATAKKAPAKKAAAKKAAAKKSTPTKAAATKAAATKPAKAKKLPKFLTDKKWLAQQRDLLLEERQSYTHSAAALAAEAASLMADREPGDVQFDEESGEGDTLAVERDRDLALSAKAREKVDEIDAALKRLDEGTYGICVASGEVIPKERLEALPMAAKTVAAQTAMF